jgi:hypothetical protein
MSFVIAAPELVEATAHDLAGIGSTLGEATAAAATPTTSIAAAGTDEVSTAIAALFGSHGQEFQALTARASAFHNEFVSTLKTGAGAYLGTEVANAEQALTGAVTAPAQALAGGGGAAGALAQAEGAVASVGQNLGGAVTAIRSGSSAAFVGGEIQTGAQAISHAIASVPTALGAQTGGAPALINGLSGFGPTVAAPYQALFSNTVANLQAIGSTFAGNPVPLLHQLVINQIASSHIIATAIGAGMQNLPAELANLPANLQAAIQGLLTINPGAVLQQFVNGQIATAQTIITSLQTAAQDINAGLPTLSAGFQAAFQDLLAGNGAGAYAALNQALVSFVLPSFTGTQIGLGPAGLGEFLVTPNGPLGALGPIFALPGQMAQDFTNLLSAGSIPEQMAQNATNLIKALTNFNSTLDLLSINLAGPSTADLSFGVPVQLIFDVVGGPANALSALNSTGVAFAGAMQAGNASAAVATLLDAPAVVANAYLNGTTVVTLPSTSLTILGLIPAVSTVNVPLGGILTPLSFPTAETQALGLTLPVDIVGGTPIGGLIPGLASIGSQLAQVITPIT